MHAFVVGFFQQRPVPIRVRQIARFREFALLSYEPAVVSSHASQAPKMPQHTPHHAWATVSRKMNHNIHFRSLIT
jgi:hypothetical protein